MDSIARRCPENHGISLESRFLESFCPWGPNFFTLCLRSGPQATQVPAVPLEGHRNDTPARQLAAPLLRPPKAILGSTACRAAYESVCFRLCSVSASELRWPRRQNPWSLELKRRLLETRPSHRYPGFDAAPPDSVEHRGATLPARSSSPSWRLGAALGRLKTAEP